MTGGSGSSGGGSTPTGAFNNNYGARPHFKLKILMHNIYSRFNTNAKKDEMKRIPAHQDPMMTNLAISKTNIRKVPRWLPSPIWARRTIMRRWDESY